MLYRRMLRPEMLAHLFRGQMGCLQRMGHLAGAWQSTTMLDAGKCCVAESSLGVGAAVANLPRERCCIGACRAQKWWRICSGGCWFA
jgi:hypothetical protein